MLIAALVLAGWVAAYLVLRYLLKRRCAALSREFQEQADWLFARARLLELTGLAQPAAPPVPASVFTQRRSEWVVGNAAAATFRPASASPADAADEVAPETLDVIAETVAAFLGKEASIRSVKKVEMPLAEPAMEQVATHDTWAREGRVLVHSSHEIVHARALTPSGQGTLSSLRGVALEVADRY